MKKKPSKANLSILIGSLLHPFMPETSNEIYRQMNLEKLLIPNAFGRLIKTDHQIKEAVPLFRKLEDAEINDYRTKFAGAQPSKK